MGEWLIKLAPAIATIISACIAYCVYKYSEKLNKYIHFPALFADLPCNLQMGTEGCDKDLKLIINGKPSEKYLKMRNIKALPARDFSWKMFWYPYVDICELKQDDIKDIKISGYDDNLYVLLNCDPFSIGMKDLLNTDIMKNSASNTYMLVIVLLCKDANGKKIEIDDSPFFYFYKTKEKEENGIKKFQFFKEHKSQDYVTGLRNIVPK